MTDSRTIEQEMAPALEALGLFFFGWFVMADAPFTGRKAALIGNRAKDGRHGMWEAFSSSPEYLDGKSNAMDRWTERVVGEVTGTDAIPLYPFGAQLWPFQRYAKAATGMQSSPLGLLIHPEFGLWQAFRAVLVFGEDVVLPIPQKLIHPCGECVEKPCLNACPVDAFSTNGFAVDRCRQHLASGDLPDCMASGCRARAACPVGVPYGDEQLRFHMKAFAR